MGEARACGFGLGLLQMSKPLDADSDRVMDQC